MKRNRWWMAKQRKADSVWEADLRDGVLKGCGYHDSKIPYTVRHKYIPDFRFYSKKLGKTIYIEAKGRFSDNAEASKYKWVRETLEGTAEELVFLFYDPNKPMPHAKKRKDGTKLSHGEWAEKNGFKHYTAETIKEILC